MGRHAIRRLCRYQRTEWRRRLRDAPRAMRSRYTDFCRRSIRGPIRAAGICIVMKSRFLGWIEDKLGAQ